MYQCRVIAWCVFHAEDHLVSLNSIPSHFTLVCARVDAESSGGSKRSARDASPNFGLIFSYFAVFGKILPNNFPHGNSGSPLERQQTDTHKGMFTALVSVVDSRLEIMVFTLLLSRVFSIRSSSPALISCGTDTKQEKTKRMYCGDICN